MPFPITPREVYRRNPLDRVVCQFDFPPILAITSTSPTGFQEAVRAEYPWYEAQSSTMPDVPAEIRDLFGSLPGLPMMEPTSHIFFTDEHKRFITLRQDSVAVTERQYQDWRTFKPSVEKCERVLQDCYAPPFYTRVGLRYRDVLNKEEYGMADVPWKDLLTPAFLGMFGDFEPTGDVLQSQARIMLRIPDVEGGVVVLEHGLPLADSGNFNIYLIDADFFTEERCTSYDAFKAADIFNKWGGRLFRWATTDTLRDCLGPIES